MTEYSDILYDVTGGIARITINRPDKYNAFRGRTCDELIDALNRAAWDRAVGVIVLTGAGEKAFCTGGDQSAHDGGYDGRGLIGLPVEELQGLIREAPKPVIARVNGFAIGGGNVLVTCCDLAIAADTAQFGQVGPKVGSVDPGFGTAYLARVVGEKKAREIWFLCRRYRAAEALAMGLVNAVVPLAELDAEVERWCQEILALSPTALAIAKRSFNSDSDSIRGIGGLGMQALALYYGSDESREGVDAFLQKRKPRFRTVAMAAFAVLAGAIALGQPATARAAISEDTVRIGVLTDLSGPYADLSGPGAVIATRMAIDDFVSQEKPPFKVELLSADHQNKADIASSKAREWIDREKVDVLTELVTTSAALAVQKLARDANRIAIVNGSASTRLTNEDCNDRTVHYAYDTYAVANGTARAMIGQGAKSWYFVTVDYAFGHSLEKDASELVKANGGTVTGTVRHPFPSNDFSSFLLRAQASGAQVIGLANAGADTVNAIKQAAEFGITRKQALTGLLMFITDVHALGLGAAQNMYLTVGFYWDLDDQTRAWSRRFFAQHKRMPTMVQAGQYSSTMHYLKSVLTAGTDEAGAVMKQMKQTPITDFFAKNGRIRDDGRMVHDMYLLQVKQPAESKAAWDYYHVRATIPADQAFQPLSASRCPLVAGR